MTVATTAGTTRFYRTHQRRSHDTACVGLTGFGSILCPPCPHIRAGAAASTASPTHNRDDVRSPLSIGPGCRKNVAIPNFGKVEYFCERGLTGFGGRWVFCPTGRHWRGAGKVNSSFRLSVKFYPLSFRSCIDEPEAPIVIAFCLIVTGIALLLSGLVAFGFHRNSLHSLALL